MSEYSEKLKDPRWQKKRLEILQRDEFTCQLCFDSESPLMVHHYNYKHGKLPWEYDDNDLITLCEVCHSFEHETRRKSENDLLESLRDKHFMSSDIDILARSIQLFNQKHIIEIHSSAMAWAIRTPEIQQDILNKYFDYIKNELAMRGKNE